MTEFIMNDPDKIKGRENMSVLKSESRSLAMALIKVLRDE